MKKDIEIPEVKNVTLAVVREKNLLNQNEWKVYLINNNNFPIENTLVASRGYGEKNGEEQRTSTLRHFLETVSPKSSAIVESIDPMVFHLNNEYWVSYYIGVKFTTSDLYSYRIQFVKRTWSSLKRLKKKECYILDSKSLK